MSQYTYKSLAEVNELVTVIVLINVKPGTAEPVYNAVQKIENVKHVHMVTGTYDVIVYAEIPERVKLRRFVNDLYEIDGVQRTETCVAI